MPATFINTKKEISATRKAWFKTTKQDKFKNTTQPWIQFLQKSGLRDCQCANGMPIMRTEKQPDGTVTMLIKCSVCGGIFYKIADYSFVMLILGRKGGGKTTFVFMFADLLHRFDPHRKIKLWQCPQNLIGVLHNLKLCNKYNTVCQRAMGEMKWNPVSPALKFPDLEYKTDEQGKVIPQPFQAKGELYKICNEEGFANSNDCQRCPHFQLGKPYFERCERLDELGYNDIVILDEGIISVNAKEALSKKMRAWDKFLAVVRQKRIVLFVLFQRYEVIKSLREMSDMILYKSLPAKIIEDEKKDNIIRYNGDRIMALKKWESILASSHQDFDSVGIVNNRVPEWYTDEVSMSYIGNSEFVDDRAENTKQLERAEVMANWLIEKGFVIEKPIEMRAAKHVLRKQFANLQPPVSSSELGLAIDAYLQRIIFGGEGQKNSDDLLTDINTPTNAVVLEDMQHANISKLELAIFEEVCRGKSMTGFNEPPYNMERQRVSEITRRVGTYLLGTLKQKVLHSKSSKDGEMTERRVVREAWNNNGYGVRSVGSGGERGDSPAADCFEITNDGKIRIVQVKERSTSEAMTFRPLTFNTEFKVMNRIKAIAKNSKVQCPHCLEYISGVLKPDGTYLYASNGSKDPILMERLELSDNKKTIRVDWANQKITRQEPDIEKIKNIKVLDFLKGTSFIYWGEEDVVAQNEKEEKELLKESITEPDLLGEFAKEEESESDFDSINNEDKKEDELDEEEELNMIGEFAESDEDLEHPEEPLTEEEKQRIKDFNAIMKTQIKDKKD